MADDALDTIKVDVEIERLDARGPISDWDDDTKMTLSFNVQDKTIRIAGNRAGLKSLARHLLTLSQEGSESGYNLYWEPESGWFESDEAGLHISLAE